MSFAAWAPAIGGVASALISGRSGGGNTTTTTEPWSKQAPYLEDLFRRSQNLLNDGGLAPVAGFDPLETAGQAQQVNTATGFAPGVINNAAGIQANLANSWNPAANPVLQQYIQSAIRPVQEQLMEGILPGLRQTYLGAGLQSSLKQGAREGKAIGDFARTAGDISTGITNNAYNVGLSASRDAMNFSPSMLQMGLVPGDILSSVGAGRRDMEQRFLDSQFNELQRYQSLVGGQNFGSEVSTPAPRTNPIQAGLAGAILTNQMMRPQQPQYGSGYGGEEAPGGYVWF